MIGELGDFKSGLVGSDHSHVGTGELFQGYPPPLRISGIIDLAGICEVIYGAQSHTGKILISKNLARRWRPEPRLRVRK